METDRVTLSAGVIDPVTAVYNGTWVVIEPNGTTFYPQSGRHVTHHEMDLMTQLAGLELESRWSDWKGTPFGQSSRLHVSIHRTP